MRRCKTLLETPQNGVTARWPRYLRVDHFLLTYFPTMRVRCSTNTVTVCRAHTATYTALTSTLDMATRASTLSNFHCLKVVATLSSESSPDHASDAHCVGARVGWRAAGSGGSIHACFEETRPGAVAVADITEWQRTKTVVPVWHPDDAKGLI